MDRRQGQIIALGFLACDLLVTAGVWFAAYFLRFSLVPAPGGVPEFDLVVAGLPMLLLLAATAYRVCGLYEVHQLRRLSREIGRTCAASGFLFLLVITVTFYRRDMYESRLALGLFLALNAVFLLTVRRLMWWGIARRSQRAAGRPRALIVGGGRTARRLQHVIGRDRWSGFEAVGYVDRANERSTMSLPRLGDMDDLPQVIAQNDINQVFIALPLRRYGELPRVVASLGDVLVEVQLVPGIPQMACMRVRSTEIEGLPLLSLRENPHAGWHRLAKRAMDLVLSAAALVVFSPLLLLLAALIKLSSPGPVFYRQTRAGLGGRPFQMLKFRSMRVDAETETGPVWAVRNDDRCTALGGFLRRWSLDELPQLINVLTGDMSMVGPRPERGVFIEKFRRQIPNYTQRHRVKSGITGWAQVNGWRGNTSLRRRVECDLYYICNWSLGMDLKILWMTLWRGFRHPNAC